MKNIRSDYFEFREMLLDSSLLGKNTVDRMNSAVSDATDLLDAQILNENDPEVRKAGWIILFEHTIDFLENALDCSTKISNKLTDFISSFDSHIKDFEFEKEVVQDAVRNQLE